MGSVFREGIAVLTVEEAGDVHGYRLDADGNLEEGSVDIDSSEYRVVTAITDGPNGLVATGNDLHPDFQNFVLTSTDGLEWVKAAPTGLEIPMDVFDAGVHCRFGDQRAQTSEVDTAPPPHAD